MSDQNPASDEAMEFQADNGTIPFDEPLETDERLDLQPNRRSILTEQGDPEVESLYQKYKRGRLIIQPDFQRQFVWDQAKSSRLIESALLRIPLPVIYLAQEKDGKEQVIDGQQRLTAFFSFIDGKFPSGADFRLSGLKVFSELSGKTLLGAERRGAGQGSVLEDEDHHLPPPVRPGTAFRGFRAAQYGSRVAQ